MPTYIERYLSGEYATVWDELYGFGDLDRESDLYRDAWAVAQETMRRIRANVEVLIPRLVRIGFRFGYDWLIQPDSHDPMDLLNQHWYITDEIEWVKQQPPVFVPATLRDDYLAGQRALFPSTDLMWPGLLEEAEKIEQSKDYVDQLDNLLGGIPLSLRAWYEIVGGINLVGYKAEWIELFSGMVGGYTETYDPLFVYPLTAAKLGQLQRQQHHGPITSYALAPDRFFKHRISGGGPYSLRVPSRSVDGIIQGGVLNDAQEPPTFVQYLRISFRFAGFPGMAALPAPAHEALLHLTEGLHLF